MFKKIILLSFLLLILLTFPLVYAQELEPGETTFTISSIIVDYLRLTGNINYLNILWEAYYWDNAQRDISLECYLNCPNLQNCVDYQGCSYLDYPAGTDGSCTIKNPNYDLSPAGVVSDKAMT